MFGWTGTILRVNLTKGTVTREATEPRLARQFIGARSMATKIMFAGVDPRIVQGIGLNYATSNRGGCRVRGYTVAVEVLAMTHLAGYGLLYAAPVA